MAPTLASIAAPAPVAAPQPVVEQRQETASQKAAVDRGLAQVKVERVRVDGLAVMKIVKHAIQSHAVVSASNQPGSSSNASVAVHPAVGQLLGIDLQGTLEVSNAFALPQGGMAGSSTAPSFGADTDASENRGLKAANKYTAAFLPRMADLNADASLVGFYTSTHNGQHLALPGFLDALLGAQLSGAGIGSNAARPTPIGRKESTRPVESNKLGKGIALVYDVASANLGYVSLRAFRLTQAFVDAHRDGARFDTAALVQHHLVPSTILEEVPLTIRSNPILTAFLSTLSSGAASSSSTSLASSSSSSSASTSYPAATSTTVSSTIGTDMRTLSLPSSNATATSLLQPMQSLLSALESHQAHLSTLSFQARQLARDRARVESLPHVVRRRADNEQRARDGLPPLPPTSDEAALVEPNRLDTMCALAAVEGASKVLTEYSGANIVRAFGAKAGTA